MYQTDTAGHGVGALLRFGTEQLRASPEAAADAARDAAQLLAAALEVPRSTLLAFPERTAPAAATARFLDWIARRRRGEPVAYLLGRRGFWTLELEVGPAVLVPRPETELLVERALALECPAAARVLDLGTGSGALALALARERAGWRISATDASEAALVVARRNAARLGLERVQWLAGDWFEAVAARRFDLVLSNPPYIDAGDPILECAPLCFEPRGALTPGPDGLAALAHLGRTAPDHLEPGGWLLLEHGATQAAALAELLVARGFRHVRSRRDLAGHERVTEAQWPGLSLPTRDCPECS
jgi:release factor glutamine methyltransferase